MFRLIFFLLFPLSLFSQNTLHVENASEDLNKEKALLSSSEEIKMNKLLNHELVDLVDAYTIDSTFNRGWERHQVIGGGFIRLLGYRWKAIDKSRQKMVGWVNRHYVHDVDKKAQFTEYDINYDLIPMLPKYIDLAYYAYQEQFGMHKSGVKSKEGQAPYIYPSEDTKMELYRIHCENTPATDFRSLLNTKFFPVHRNNELKVHPNFQDEHPVMGMYGVLVLDCNHTCHPEIHPYEWVWWLNVTEEKPTWNIGFIRDVSSRFKHWSSAPRTGAIKLPFSFPLDASNWTLEVHHDMFGNFSQEGFKELSLPEANFNFTQTERRFDFDLEALASKSLLVKSNVKVPYESLVYYFSDLQVDVENNLFTGYFNLATSINEVYTAQVKTLYEANKKDDFAELIGLMTGSFNSYEQARLDTNYYKIDLHMYPIWEDKEPGWFYVEQALSSSPEKPYRQRIYKLTQIDAASFESAIYLLKDETAAIGKWQDSKFFDTWTKEDLSLKNGCAVYLKKARENMYLGSTLYGTCESNLKGASFATTRVLISKEGIDSWDQGFDMQGQQVWGAEHGAYQFRRKL